MNKEKDLFKTCFNTVTGLEVKNESQAIAKEVVLSEIENLQEENKQLKDNWNKLKEYIKQEPTLYFYNDKLPFEVIIAKIINKMQEIEQESRGRINESRLCT